MVYDLLLKGGKVIDPSQRLHARRDLAFADSKVAAIAEDIPVSEAKEVIDCTDKIVTPGFVDLHTHVFWGATDLGVNADELGQRSGVTTFVDAGSAGWANWRGFCEFIIRPSHARILAFVHISRIGLTDVGLGECRLLDACVPERAAAILDGNRNFCVGIKVRMGKRMVGEHGLKPLELAVKAAEMVNAPVMVHIGDTVCPLPEILDLLRPGDIVTHCYTGAGNGILTGKTGGKLLEEVREAHRQGIVFDVGHGAGSLNFHVCRAAIDQGFLPDVISTDIHTGNIKGCVIDLPTTMSKFLNLGMALEDVVERVTVAPAKAVGREDLGSLRVGGVGDAAVLTLKEGKFEFQDSNGNKMTGKLLLTCVLTVKDGKVWAQARKAMPQ